MTRILEAIMRHTLAPRQLPTGPNPMPPLSDFTVTEGYSLAVRLNYGRCSIAVDPVREVGFFEQGCYRGKFWTAGGVYLGSDHVLPRDVQLGLIRLGYEVA